MEGREELGGLEDGRMGRYKGKEREGDRDGGNMKESIGTGYAG